MVRLRQALHRRIGRPWPAPTTPALNILPSRVITAQSKATGNTAQWVAFKSRLDGQLASVVTGGFEGSSIPWAQDFALGYQCLQGSDPTTANKYADKAIALLWTNFSDLVRSGSQSRQFLAQGDGGTTVFTLPNTPAAGTFNVYLGTVSAVAVVRGGTPNGQDGSSGSGGFGADATAIKIVSTNDITAAPAYIKNTDWQQVGDYCDGTVDWSLGGSEPTAGTTYYVVISKGSSATKQTTGFTQSGTALTFTTAPTTSQAVFVEYLYTDANGNAYRQTGCGFGGYNYLLVDVGFQARYIRFLCAAADWLWNYANFPAALKTLIISCLKSWQGHYYDGTTGGGPTANAPLSGGAFQNNYTAGFYSAQLFSALALNGRDLSASTLLSQITTWRTTYLQPGLSGAQSLAGGQPPEWWNYGPFTLEGYLAATDAYNDSGNGTFSDELTWAADIINCCTLERPTATTMITAGTLAFPAAFPPPSTAVPNSNFLSLACFLSNNATKTTWGNYMLQNQYSAITVDASDLLFRDPSATAADYTASRPLGAYLAGPLTWMSRADNTDTGMFVWSDLGNAIAGGHYCVPFATGHIGISRGVDLLVYNGWDVGGAAGGSGQQTSYANIVLCDDAGAGYQTYDIANNGGVPRMGNASTPYPAGFIPSGNGGLDVASAGYAYGATLDLPLTFVKSTNTSLHTCQHFQRRVLHVRPDYVFVHDRVQLTLATFTAWQQWHSQGTLTLGGADNWTYAVGSSKLFGKCYSGQGLTTTSATPTVNGHTINQVKHALTTGTTTAFTFMTALQAAPSTTGAMDATTYITSGDARFDGVLIGTVLALFPQAGDVNPWSGSTSYSATYSGTITHYVCGVEPNRTFTVGVSVGSGPGTATSSAGGVLTFQTTGTGAAQTVTLT